MSPRTVSVDVGRQMIQAVLGAGSPTSMMMVFFPAPVAQEQRSKFLEISGLVSSVACRCSRDRSFLPLNFNQALQHATGAVCWRKSLATQGTPKNGKLTSLYK